MSVRATELVLGYLSVKALGLAGGESGVSSR